MTDLYDRKIKGWSLGEGMSTDETAVLLLSCPEIGLHNSVKFWKDIQKHHLQNGSLSMVKNLNGLSVMIF